MAKTVVGLFDTAAEAQSVVQELVNSGFQHNDISLVANDAKGEYANYHPSDTAGSSTAEGAGAGAVGGGVLGGVLGLLVGVGALAIPGIGPVLAAGPLAAALGAAGASTLVGAGIGAAAGGIIGALVGAGIPEEDAGFYAEGVRRGGTLV
ncbi:MAG: general stress protein, partial [Roseiflexaceae bacterium]